jgi:cobalt-zinc-cadmium efflux system outer membrane protein
MRLLLYVPLGVAAAYPQSALDLKAALQLAESDNLELRAARQQRAIALAGLTVAGQLPNPIITFSASRDAPHESTLWDQPIELGGKRGKRLALAQEEQKATEIDIVVLSRQIRQRTREAFYRALWSRAQAEQSKAALDLATRIRDIVQQRFEAGDVAQLEVIQAEVERGRASTEYEVALQAQKTADAQLSALLNGPLDKAWDLQGRLSDIPGAASLQALTDTALGSNAEVRRATQEMEVEQRRLALAKAERIPNLDLQAGVDLNAPHDYSVGPRGQVGISLPIFYHGQGEVAQSTARLEFLRLALQAQKTNVSVQVLAAYFDYTAKTRQAEEYAQKIVPQTVQLEDMAEESYRAGKSNLLTLIDAQRKLNETRKAYLDSLFAVQGSFAALEEVVGTPLD